MMMMMIHQELAKKLSDDITNDLSEKDEHDDCNFRSLEDRSTEDESSPPPKLLVKNGEYLWLKKLISLILTILEYWAVEPLPTFTRLGSGREIVDCKD